MSSSEEPTSREDLENVKMSRPLEAIKRITFDEQPDGRQQSSVSRSPVSTNSRNYGGDNSVNMFGGKNKIESLTISGGTGNSPTNRTVPGYGEDLENVKMSRPLEAIKRITFDEQPDGRQQSSVSRSPVSTNSRNYGGDNSVNMFGGKNKIESLTISGGTGNSPTNRTVPGYGGYTETDPVRTTGRAPDSAGDLKAEEDNTLAQDIHDVINQSLKSVGFLKIAELDGTAFRVGSKYAMTNWHMIQGCVDPHNTGRMDFNNLEICNAFINFSADPYSPSQQIFYMSSTVPYFDVQLDIAVIELKIDNSVNLPPALPLCTEHEECTNVHKLKVLGFGHPENVKKNEEFATVIPPELPQRVNEAQDWVTENKERLKSDYEEHCRAMGETPKSFTWDYGGWDDAKNVAFDIYKEKGSSGSPALICADATKVKVMAVVYRGMPDCFWELPSFLRLEFPTRCRIELAVKMSHIYVSMQKQDPTLTNDVFKYRKM